MVIPSDKTRPIDVIHACFEKKSVSTLFFIGSTNQLSKRNTDFFLPPPGHNISQNFCRNYHIKPLIFSQSNGSFSTEARSIYNR